jgi:predicted ribonuclease YlaK
MAKICLDTNVLLENPEILDTLENIVLCTSVLEEIDGLKKGELGHLAREVNRKIEANINKIEFVIKDVYDNIPDGWDKDKRDNKIIFAALECGAKLLSNDINVRIKAKVVGVECEGYGSGVKPTTYVDYSGYKEIEFTHQELADFYNNINKNEDYGLKEGQYLLIKDSETKEIVDKYKYSDGMFKKLKYTAINSKAMGKIKPRNIQQELLFDMLQDDTKTVFTCIGGWGTGKDFCMLSHAFQLIDKRKFEKLIFCRNNIDVKNSNGIGFLKGSLVDKLMPYAQVVCDHVGGQFGLNMMLDNGTIELQHLGFLRGRDIKNSIIYCSEAENMTKEHIQLLLGRVGEGSIIMFNGDFRQIDARVFEINNGLNAMIDKFKGHKKFGIVKLVKTERSETAAMADLLD